MTRTIIRSSALQVGIDSRGAELGSINFHGIELLWQRADPWHFSAPILFPIISRLPGDTLLHNGMRYPIASHGVARRSEFVLESHGSDAATFLLLADPETRAHFPFDFELRMSFAVRGAELTVTHDITNTGTEALPFLLGGHPAFHWPLPGAASGADHTVSWRGGGTTMRQAVNGLLPSRFDSPAVDGTLVLEKHLFERDALLFDDLHPRSVIYTAEGAPAITMRFDDFGRFGIWSRSEGAEFVCLEPWSGYPATAEFDGDILDLPEAEVLPRGESRRFTYSLEITEH